ncbi:MAG: HAD-IIIC family phosphatase, partial [Ruminococcaceae bacterium]|nr:HAD-IIIC family phosphatase [Oscillospiraceae bacterium]
MLSFSELKKASKKDASSFKKIKVAVMGDCATQHISQGLKGYAYSLCYNFDLFDADYNQIDPLVIDPSSELYEFAPDITVIYNCTQKLYDEFTSIPQDQRGGFADAFYARMKERWSIINSRIKTKIIQTNFPEDDDMVFGSYASKVGSSFINQLRKLNVLIAEGSSEVKNVFVADVQRIYGNLGKKDFCDSKMYYIAKIPMAVDAIPYFAKEVCGIFLATDGKFKKCAVLDLDNTLWGGVIGDDGMDGIQIGELGSGHAFSDLQRWLKELKERGIILAVCSKNNEDTAKRPFTDHPEMTLRLDDISMFVANWEDKASNIKRIQKTLNIGMDSMVFIDDNPFERDVVRSLVPDICVPEMPEDPAEYLSFLKDLDLFETASYSAEDKDRTKQYQAEIGRIALQESFGSFDDYLKGLEMYAVAAPFDSFNFPRISQLTQRSNQFNLRTVRYTEAEIEAIAKDEDHFTLYFTLKDKFGDHGLISVVILDKREDCTLFISE